MAIYSVTDASGLYRYCNGSYGGPKATAGDIISIPSTFIIGSGFPTLAIDPGVTVIGGGSLAVSIVMTSAITNHPFHIVGSGNSTWYNNPITISGLAISYVGTVTKPSPLNQNSVFACRGAKVILRDVRLNNTAANSGTKTSVLYVESSSGVRTYLEGYNCVIGPSPSSVVVTNVTSGGVDAQLSSVKFYDSEIQAPSQCNSYTPVPTEVNLESKGGFPIYMYGGKISNGPVSRSNGGAIYCYFTDINTNRLNGTNAHLSGHNISDAYVLYGNNISISGEIKGNPSDVRTANRSVNPSLGQSVQRSGLLIKENNINWVGNFGVVTNLIENTVNTSNQDGGDYYIYDNLITQGNAFNNAAHFFRMFSTSGNTVTGQITGNTIVGNGNTSTALNIIRIGDTRTGNNLYGFNTTLLNNTFLRTGDLYYAFDANISGVAAFSSMLFFNNLCLVSGQFMNTSGTFPASPSTAAVKFNKYGSISAYNNIFNFPQNEGYVDATSVNGNDYAEAFNVWNTIPGISGQNALYTIIPGGNVETSSFPVTDYSTVLTDTFKQSVVNVSGISVGSKWRQTWRSQNIEILPTIIVT